MLADMGPVELSSSKSLAISPCIVNVSCVSSKSKARKVSNTDPEIITIKQFKGLYVERFREEFI